MPNLAATPTKVAPRSAHTQERTRAANSSFSPVVAALATGLFFAVVTFVWLSLDSRVPSTDEAGHILNSLAYRDLLQHIRPFKAAWWHSFLTVNSFYPPAVYITSALLKILFGASRSIDALCMSAYVMCGSASIYGICYLLTSNRWSGVLAAVLFNFYPQIQWLTHNYMLDFPVAAMVAVGWFALLWWNAKPSFTRACVSSAVLAAACMTKQIAGAYLILPGVWCAIAAWRRDAETDSVQQRAQIALMGASVLAVALPWIIVNHTTVQQIAAENSAAMRHANANLVAWKVFPDYLLGVAHSMSPILVAAFFVSLTGLSWISQKRLFPIYLGALGGLALISCLSWTYPLDRYAAPVLVASAIISACGVIGWYERRVQWITPLLATVVFVALLQTASFSWSPYPLSQPEWLSNFSTSFGVSLREFRGATIPKSCPTGPNVDWGHKWCLDTIREHAKGNPWLNILPSDACYNPHSFELIARETQTHVRPTSSRRWTIEGDEVAFTPESALWFDWYLLKSGDQGNKLKDDSSKAAYEQLKQYVRTSGRFELVGERLVPDRSTIYLYRQR